MGCVVTLAQCIVIYGFGASAFRVTHSTRFVATIFLEVEGQRKDWIIGKTNLTCAQPPDGIDFGAIAVCVQLDYHPKNLVVRCRELLDTISRHLTPSTVQGCLGG